MNRLLGACALQFHRECTLRAHPHRRARNLRSEPRGLALIAFVFIVARVLHGIGMDGGEQRQFRMFGMMG